MKRRLVVLLMLMIVYPAFSQQKVIIRIPTLVAAQTMPIDERRELEILFATTVEKALRDGVVIPGQQVDFAQPNIWFVREYNLWIEKRTALAEAFGIDIFREAIDVQEMMKFERATTAWKDYCAGVEENYKQYKRANKAFKDLERTLGRERDGVYR